MKDTREILDLYQSACESGQRVVVATVVDVTGSAYRRPGAHLLLTDDGKKAGSISAGCLENDILARSDELFSLQRCLFLQYENDEFFGLNYGCDGTISVLVEPISPGKITYLDAFKLASASVKPVIVATVYACDREDVIGAKQLSVDGKVVFSDLPRALADLVSSTIAGLTVLENRTNKYDELHARVFFEVIKPTLRMVIFGAGDDVIPVIDLAQFIGIETSLVDSRRSYLDRHAGRTCTRHFDVHSNDFKSDLFDVPEQTAVVIMSHNFELDKRFLKYALGQNCRYLGIMGSRKRTMKLLSEIDEIDAVPRIQFPIGLDLGADTPEEIALSIVSEVMMNFRKASGKSLSKIHGPVHRRRNQIDIAILAAGQGSRMGGLKQLTLFEGETLLARSIRAAKESGVGRIIVVLGSEYEEVSQHVPDDVVTVLNTDWQEGIASSIRTAVEAALDSSASDALLFMTSDQPFVDAALLQKLAHTYETSSNSIVAASYGTPGIPAIFPREKFPHLLKLKGDKGAKQLILSNAAELVEAPLARYDVDTQKDLQECREAIKPDNKSFIEY